LSLFAMPAAVALPFAPAEAMALVVIAVLLVVSAIAVGIELLPAVEANMELMTVVAETAASLSPDTVKAVSA
jgi:hypothetical protein